MRKIFLILSLFIFSCDEEAEDNSTIGITGTVKNTNGELVAGSAILLTYETPVGAGMEGGRPSTTIDLTLATDSNVNAWILDVCNDTINVLVDETMMMSGYHTISWNANDSSNNQVVDGLYTIMVTVGTYSLLEDVVRAQMDYSHLNSIDGQNYHAMTDEDGLFNIPLDCLSFGYEYETRDEEGNSLGSSVIPYTTKIWVIHPDYEPYSTDYIDVVPGIGSNINIILP